MTKHVATGSGCTYVDIGEGKDIAVAQYRGSGRDGRPVQLDRSLWQTQDAIDLVAVGVNIMKGYHGL